MASVFLDTRMTGGGRFRAGIGGFAGAAKGQLVAGDAVEAMLNETEFRIMQEVAEQMNQIPAEIIRRVKQRTTSGVDVNGAPFVPYSEGYGERVKGRRTPVTLVETGTMLGALGIVDETELRVELGFRSNTMRRRASFHQYGRGPNPRRQFLWLDTTEIHEFEEEFRAGILNAVPSGRRIEMRLQINF